MNSIRSKTFVKNILIDNETETLAALSKWLLSFFRAVNEQKKNKFFQNF